VATLSIVGWPDDAPRLDLDHERFAYAGKFVTGTAGIGVVRDGGDVVAAASFSPDRTDGSTLRLRYVTVREDQRGERLGPRLCAFVARRARERGYDRVAIAVNNPVAFVALYRAGFGATGERTGMAEHVLLWPDPTDRDPAAYRAGLAAFAERDLPEELAEFVAARRDGEPPAVVDEARRGEPDGDAVD
jgi:GNAT superfamily N-acetyltransferase